MIDLFMPQRLIIEGQSDNIEFDDFEIGTDIKVAGHDLGEVAHQQLGYLAETNPGQIAAARAPSDQPLTYKVRLRVPPTSKFSISANGHKPCAEIADVAPS